MSDINLATASADELRAYIARMQAAPQSRVTYKVSEKGCVSVYGLNVRGIHLYASQWLRILERAEELRAFIKTNTKALSWKNGSTDAS